MLNDHVYSIQGRSRQDYVNRLTADLCEYYGYNEFMMEKLLAIFGTKEVCARTDHSIYTLCAWAYIDSHTQLGFLYYTPVTRRSVGDNMHPNNFFITLKLVCCC